MAIKKIKFGVIGTSRVALKGMLPAMRDSEFAELTMIGSRDREKAKSVAEQFGAKLWGTYEDVLKSSDVDAIYVSLPNSLHEEWSIKAIESGKHVICEKPAAISYESGKKMVGAANRNNVRLLEGYMFRYHPQNVKIREMIKEGALGNLLRFEGVFGYAMPEKGSVSMNKSLSGGSFYMAAGYPVSASRMIFSGEPESVFCTIEFDAESGVSIKTDMMLAYYGGKSAFVSSIFGSYFQSTYSVLGTKASVRMGRAYAVPREMGTKLFFDTDDKIEEIVVDPADHFQLMLDDFCEEISRGGDRKKDYEGELLAQARVMEAAMVSHVEKRLVKISEIV